MDFALASLRPKTSGWLLGNIACSVSARKAIGAIIVLGVLLGSGCKPDDDWEGSHRFPDYVSKIMRRNCAVTGCHNAESAEATAGLSLENWYEMFNGARGGSPVVPYSPDQSYLLFTINTDTARGPVISPTMPIGSPALTEQQYQDLRQWILEGARNDRGKERFPPEADRRKWYVSNEGCDLVAVFDAESRQIMRFVSVGVEPDHLEEPHTVVVSPDRSAWYVVFNTFSPHIEHYSTLTDQRVADIPLGQNGWNTMAISPDNKFGFVASEYLRDVVVVDLVLGQVVGSVFTLPQNIYGAAIHSGRATLYLCQNRRSGLFALDYDGGGQLGNLRTIDMVQGSLPVVPGEVWPTEVQFLPDGSKYFVVCQHSKEVRVMDGATDQLLDVVPVGELPRHLAYSSARGLVFVSCMEDESLYPGDASKRGSIIVIDAQTHQVVKTIYAGFQPDGISIDEAHGCLVVVNRNQLATGPAPHHGSTCAGRNGYVTLIDLATLELVPNAKFEVAVSPNAIAVKQ